MTRTTQERAEEIRREMLATGQAKYDLAEVLEIPVLCRVCQQPLERTEALGGVVDAYVHQGDEPDHAPELPEGHPAQTWTTEQLKADFTVTGFSAPFVVVRRKSDGKLGTLEFTHSPRVYFGWTEA
jgi:hypothetical protein